MRIDLSKNEIHSFFTNESVTLPDHFPLSPNQQYSQKRLSDFSTGRYCAIKALEKLGIKDVHIPIGEDRAPVWPEGIVGSISHCDSLVGAIVAKNSDHISLGLDIEEIGRVTPDLWDLIFTQKEKDFLINLSDRELQEKSTAIFSIKEAYYKFQYPITKTYLDFLDVEVELQNFNNVSVLSNIISESSNIRKNRVSHYLECGCVVSIVTSISPIY